MKMTDDSSHFPNPQHELWFTFGLLVGQAFRQVEAHIASDSIKLAEVPAFITVSETASGDSDRVAIAE
jgi:hypothetical protein